MLKRSLLIFFLFFCCFAPASLYSQDCPELFQANHISSYEICSYDAKHKQTSSTVYTLDNVSENKVMLTALMKDKKGASQGEMNYDILCEGSTVKVNMEHLFYTMNSFSQNEDLDVESEIIGEHLSYPQNMEVGQSLKDGSLETETMMQNALSIKITMDFTDRKVLVHENIETPAGTFKAFKITSTNLFKMGFMTIKTKQIQWYVPDLGLVVKSESYDKKGKLSGTTSLCKVERN